MRAELLLRESRVLEPGFIEVVIWRLQRPLGGSAHSLKYRYAYVIGSKCVLRYDNEVGKGEHRQVGDIELPYGFVSFGRLIDDFLADVAKWKRS